MNTLRIHHIVPRTCLYTGYRWEVVQRHADLLSNVDVVLEGPYPKPKTVQYMTSRYSAADLDRVPHTEVIIDERGDLVMTGIDPGRLQ